MGCLNSRNTHQERSSTYKPGSARTVQHQYPVIPAPKIPVERTRLENTEQHIVSASFAAAFARPERLQAVSLPIVMSRRPAMKTRLACLLVAFATLVLPELAHACGDGAVQFADDFKTPDAGWLHNDQVKIGSGAIALLPTVNKSTYAYNASYLFSDADVCIQIKVSDFTKPEQLSGGLMFWMTDGNSYYLFRIYQNGVWRIDRRAGSRWIGISTGNSDAIKKGAGDLNEIELRVSGNTGTAYVNGAKVATFNGQSPDGGGFFGVTAESENERANIWEARDFKILKLQ
jgi:hypothetical protein